MLNALNDLIAKGGFTGINVAVRPLSDTELSVIVTAQAGALKGDSHIKEDESLDAYYALRQALVTPQVFSGTAEQIDAQISEFVDTIGESVKAASEQLTALGKAAKLDAATASAQAATQKDDKKKSEKKKTDTKAAKKSSEKKPAESKAQTKADNAPAQAEQQAEPEKEQDKPQPQATAAMFDDIDSV